MEKCQRGKFANETHEVMIEQHVAIKNWLCRYVRVGLRWSTGSGPREFGDKTRRTWYGVVVGAKDSPSIASQH